MHTPARPGFAMTGFDRFSEKRRQFRIDRPRSKYWIAGQEAE